MKSPAALRSGAPASLASVATCRLLMCTTRPGRLATRGAVWTARNKDTATIARGERCKVVDVDRLTIFLKPERERS